MITVTPTRVKSGEHFDFGARQLTTEQAMESLVKYELGYGGRITEASPTRIVVQTRVLGHCLDTTIFEGSEEEMRPLRAATYYFLRACGEQMTDLVFEQAFTDLSRKDGTALQAIVAWAGPLIIGRHRVRVAMMLAIGITSEEDIKAALAIPDGDFVATLELHSANPNMPLRDIIHQTMPSAA
ncbi:MAG: hypothetical protein A2745_00100 [Candidatus Harrisonbacteria bacterium RIFCSPHIGHO2_01_FULL_44_13]|uniref:Uncharacterized protein n=1 Tax=Candidatus Harrisonbacteria bacterium RIFCSPLOWO2_01_FULL_44_18 TaxID=1798407 RepID=A0A1G1ZN45_9BACT|nr:MAG: hypothetical protein A2745_00100 [Candidatus Harrisonbacteria bacterium RIFCSPHIGHO2_01_FULL_44_13]OGY65839.1 MAG: hypothetical protein A3A16_02120 [Candidatus Harrisonbacteria bacterium RIFCSPLOWO2_01_FULL_44_18]